MDLDPLSSYYTEALIDAQYMAREYNMAAQAYQGWREVPIHMIAEKAACHAQLGQMDIAREIVAEFNSVRPRSFDLDAFIRMHVAMCRLPQDRELWLEGYRKAGLLP